MATMVSGSYVQSYISLPMSIDPMRHGYRSRSGSCPDTVLRRWVEIKKVFIEGYIAIVKSKVWLGHIVDSSRSTNTQQYLL